MTEHTPAPWTYSPHSEMENRNFEILADYDGNQYHSSIADTNTAANAQLIAAAPELLEALKSLVNAASQVNGRPYIDITVTKAQRAINKAEGK